MIDVSSTVSVYEVNRDTKPDASPIHVKSHWAAGRSLVILQLPGGLELTVQADDLRAAIDNATHRGAP